MPTRSLPDPVPFKVLTFLDAVARSRSIREALTVAGYSQAEDDWAWQRIVSVAGYRIKPGPEGANADAARALVELDNLGGRLLARLAVALRHVAGGEPGAFVLRGVALEGGADAVFAVATVLERIEVLGAGRERDATRRDDQAALASLEARGLGAVERSRLAELVARARAAAEPPTFPGEPLDNQRRAADLRALRRWYDDWSATARAVLTRRHQLERLGLRRGRASGRAPATPPIPKPGGAAAAPPRGNGGRGGATD